MGAGAVRRARSGWVGEIVHRFIAIISGHVCSSRPRPSTFRLPDRSLALSRNGRDVRRMPASVCRKILPHSNN